MMDTLRGMRKSATMWFNGLLLAALPVFEMAVGLLPELHEFLPDNVYKTMGIVAIVGNALLRLKTTAPLSEK